MSRNARNLQYWPKNLSFGRFRAAQTSTCHPLTEVMEHGKMNLRDDLSPIMGLCLVAAFAVSAVAAATASATKPEFRFSGTATAFSSKSGPGTLASDLVWRSISRSL